MTPNVQKFHVVSISTAVSYGAEIGNPASRGMKCQYPPAVTAYPTIQNGTAYANVFFHETSPAYFLI